MITRAHPRVNINVGLRYDYFGNVRNRGNQNPTGFFLGSGSNIFEQIQNGRVLTEQNAPDRAMFRSDNFNIAPRLGFALALTADHRTTLRGGYGMSYERPTSNLAFNIVNSLQSINAISLTSSALGVGTIPLTTSNFGIFGGSSGAVALPPTIVAGFQRDDFETARVHFWNLALERELLFHTVGSIQYAGSAGRNLYALSNINRTGAGAAFLGNPVPTARLNLSNGPIYFFNNDGRSNYHALIAELSNNTWRSIGLQFTARYRYSKAMDNLNTISTNGFANFLNPFDPGLDYGPADYDLRHRFIASFNWEVPFDRLGGSGILTQALGGWEVTGIVQARSGNRFTIFNCARAATADSPCPRVLVNGDVSSTGIDDSAPDTTIPNRFAFLDVTNFNFGSFFNPATGSSDVGPFPSSMIGRNFFRGPRYWTFDAGIHKRFRLSEDAGLQFRAELYNVFNHANLFVPNGVDLNSTTLVPAFRSGRRHLQLAVKLTF